MTKTLTAVRPPSQENAKYLGKGIVEMKENPAPKAEEIIGQGVLIKGSKACIYANAKVGKSLFSTQLGLSCASGTPFLDIPVIYPCNVLYLNFELDDRKTEDRIMEIKEKLGLTDVPKFRKLSLLGEDVPLLDTESGFKQAAAILEMNQYDGFEVELLIWDCRYKTIQQSENQDDVMKKWVRNMDELIKRYGFTLLVIHHKGKDTKGAGAGSSVFDRWINTSIELKPHDSTSALSHSRERKVIFGGNYMAGLEIPTLLEYPIHVIGGEEASKKPKSQLEQAKDAVKDILSAGTMGQEELEERLTGEGRSRDTFFRAKRALETEGFITTQKDSSRPGNHKLIVPLWLP